MPIRPQLRSGIIYSCNPAGGCTFVNNTMSCSDGNACTANDTCGGGVCAAGDPVNCDDGNACTTDSCDPVNGCAQAALNDGTVCCAGSACP